jgi:GDP-4-dehydro-6-deoxy-D-mannose reductase
VDIERRILITGASGFVGRHLLRQIQEQQRDGWLVSGWYLKDAPRDLPSTHWMAVDLQAPEAVAASVRNVRPTHIIHLAAIADVGGSFANARATWSANVMGTLNLLEALREHAPDAALLMVSSSEVYGDAFTTGVALDESAPMLPQNPYAASKAAAELLARTYAKRGLKLVIARPFNHIGPGQSEQFAVSAFARQLARIEAGLQVPELSVGNLDARRDFTDVRDIVRAYLALIVKASNVDAPAVNLCSGTPRRIGDVLDQLIALSGVNVQISAGSDPAASVRHSLSRPAPQRGRATSSIGSHPFHGRTR